MRQSVTDATFAAFLHCETKAFLFNEGVAGTRSDMNSWELRRARAFKASAADWLRSTVSDKKYFVGMPPARILEQALYQIILDPLMETPEVRSQPDALWLMPSGLEGSGVLYSPVRFVRHEKLSIIDKMMLAFDAIAIVCVTGRMPRSGKLIHGSQFATVTVPLAKLLESTQLCLTKVLSQQANGTPPPLILNKHCPVCEFRSLIPIARSEANAAGGTGSDVFNAKIIRETISACSTTMDNPDLPEVVAETIAGLKDIAPTNAREAMLAAQLLATHTAVMDSLGLARTTTGLLSEAHLGHAIRLSHAHAALSEALDRTRRGDRRVVERRSWPTRHARRRNSATRTTGNAAARRQADASAIDEGRCRRRERQTRARELSG